MDKASYGGHLYSDKAPGLSIVEIPGAEAARLPPMSLVRNPTPRLWGVRLLSGIAFVLAAFMVGKVTEGLALGCRAPRWSRSGWGRRWRRSRRGMHADPRGLPEVTRPPAVQHAQALKDLA
jgi:hypothetical protein